VKVGGRWKYLFRAVDAGLTSCGQTAAILGQPIVFWEKRCRPFATGYPSSITTDQLDSYPKAIRRLQREGKLSADTKHRTCKYLNDSIEADHGEAQASDSSHPRLSVDADSGCYDQGL
jgi:transposase-like protein